MIIRGTTPYHIFILPMKVEEIDKVYVTYSQNNEVILDKSNEDMIIEDIGVDDTDTDNASMEELTNDEQYTCKITIHLTQEDTLSFKIYPFENKNIAEIQMRLLDTDGEAYASDVLREKISNVKKEGVIE